MIAAFVALTFASACGARIVPKDGVEKTLDEILDGPVRVMWVAAHPDDEGFAGGVLSKAAANGEVYLLVLTHGDGGACHVPTGCGDNLGDWRHRELMEVAYEYDAILQHERYFNAPLPVESFPPRHELARMWIDKGDPTLKIAAAIRRFRPDVIFALGPTQGGTGHPEHQLASRFAMAGVRMAADPKADVPGDPWRVPNTYYLLSKWWLARVIGIADPETPSEKFDLLQYCSDGMSCAEQMAEHTRPHKSQAADAAGLRFIANSTWSTYLYRVDPFTEIADPLEPVEHGGMNLAD